MNLTDSLLTISPITDVLPLPTTSQNEVDLICLSGYHLRSNVTFVKEYIPCEAMKLRDIQGVKRVFTIRDRKLANALDLFVVISTNERTLVLVPIKPNQFEEGDPAKYDFSLSAETLSCFTTID